MINLKLINDMNLRIFFLISLLFLTQEIISQSWVRSTILFSDNDINEIQSAISSDGSVFTLGYFSGTLESKSGILLNTEGGRDYFLAKFSSGGSVEWLKQFGGPDPEFFTGGVSIDSNDAIFITGAFFNYLKYSPNDSIFSEGSYDIFLAKIALDGNVAWCKNIGYGTGLQFPVSLNNSSDGNLLLNGTFSDSIVFGSSDTLVNENAKNDFFYSKFNRENGELVWVKQIHGISNSGNLWGIKSGIDHILYSGMYNDSIRIENDTITSENNNQEIIVLKTDNNGVPIWKRTIQGEGLEYTYSITSDLDNNVYIGGYYNSPSLIIDSTDNDFVMHASNNGNYDIFIAKYSSDGIFQWIKTTGGIGLDKIFDIAYWDNQVHISGLFSDTLYWGGIELGTTGTSDQDMLYGSLDLDGSLRSANGYSGDNNSTEEARAIFDGGEELFTVIRSNSLLLELDVSYVNNYTDKFFIAMGVIGCLPIDYDFVNKTDITDCYGDETGIISIGASGGFGGPYQYSIDNGGSYQSNSNFTDLPAGTYNLTVKDAKNCVEVGPEVILTEPTEITISNVASDDALCNGDNGSIIVEASGGTGSLFYSTDGGTTFPTAVGSAVDVPAGDYNIAVQDGNSCEVAGPLQRSINRMQ